MMIDLTGRRVLVTGAAGGLGSDVVRFLIEANASVLATDVDDAKGALLRERLRLAPDALPRFRYLAIDQSRPNRIGDALEGEFRAVGGVDSLVNNAAIYPSIAAEDMELDDFSRVQIVNTEAAFAFAKACVPHMKRGRFGRIINIASNTFELGLANLSAYVASKGALIGLARVWAREFGPYGITVNCVSPGAIPTDAEKIHSDPEKYHQFVIERQAVKRRGAPADVAAPIIFLLSEQAGFITGQNIRVDGGWVMN